MLIYLIIINIIGFILCYLKKYNVLNIISILGGSLGIIIGILLFDRNLKKDNILYKVFSICIFIIEIFIYIIFKYKLFNINFWLLFTKYKELLIYFISINILTFIIFTLDKIKAIYHKWRFKVGTLLILCFIGGSLGGLLSMYLFRHKTKKNYFTIVIPLIIIIQMLILVIINNFISNFSLTFLIR